MKINLSLFADRKRGLSGIVSTAILVLYPTVGVGHDGHHVDPEQDGAPVFVERLPVLID